MDYNNYLIGVSSQWDDLWMSYQFIFKDGTRTEASEAETVDDWWTDHIANDEIG